MKHVIAGTAGHVDHGKTALVRALTGIDTDRLDEEKRRGISIDIGFAHLDLAPGLRVAFIDVPGHERFIKNMLAGVGGIDFVILVVAADESVRPQTREHFDICRLLRIPAGVVALTKSDRVDEDTLGVTKLEIEDFVEKSFLEGCAVIPVSSVTGEGLEALRAEIAHLARSSPSRDATQHLRLPVDRSFVMQGFGTVVTGTVLGGAVRLDDEVQLYPGGQTMRVRGLHVHGNPAKQAYAGQRAALNLSGIEHTDIRRGMTIGARSVLSSNTVFECEIELLRTAKPLKNRAPVHLHCGTAEVEAEVRALDNRVTIEPGASLLARIILRTPILMLPGDRFVLRMWAPVSTIGGGKVVDCDPPRRMHRDRLLARAQHLANCTPSQRIKHLVAEEPDGMPVAAVVARTGAKPSALPQEIPRFGNWLIGAESLQTKLASFRQILGDFHRTNPLLPGCSKEELRSRVFAGAPQAVFEAVLTTDSQIVVQGEFVRLASHRVALQADERDASARMEAVFKDAGLSVPLLSEVLRTSGVDPTRARTLLQILLRERRLVRVSEDLVFHPSALDRLRAQLVDRKGAHFSIAEFKDWTAISRKYAIPLLEWLDSQRVTRREGETRIVL